MRSFRSQRWQWDSPWESAADPFGVCSRWNSWTGWIGALKILQTKHLFGCKVGDASAAFFFFFFSLEVSPVFSVVFLHLCQMRAGESWVTTGHPRFSPESQRLTCVTFSPSCIFLALRHSLSWLDCTGKTNYDNSLCLMSSRYIFYH